MLDFFSTYDFLLIGVNANGDTSSLLVTIAYSIFGFYYLDITIWWVLMFFATLSRASWLSIIQMISEPSYIK
jgi:hypothetical protein